MFESTVVIKIKVKLIPSVDCCRTGRLTPFWHADSGSRPTASLHYPRRVDREIMLQFPCLFESNKYNSIVNNKLYHKLKGWAGE
jgi:hypothetical protein